MTQEFVKHYYVITDRGTDYESIEFGSASLVEAEEFAEDYAENHAYHDTVEKVEYGLHDEEGVWFQLAEYPVNPK